MGRAAGVDGWLGGVEVHRADQGGIYCSVVGCRRWVSFMGVVHESGGSALVVRADACGRGRRCEGYSSVDGSWAISRVPALEATIVLVVGYWMCSVFSRRVVSGG